jgi:soluble lytic murein transglycosylase
VTIGEEQITRGDYDAAIAEFWKAREESSDPNVVAAAQLGTGRVLLMQEDYQGAVDQLNWLISNFPEGESRKTAWFLLAKAYEGLDQFRLAADAYQNYLTESPGVLDSEILEMQGDAFVAAGDADAARNSYLLSAEKASVLRADPLQIKIAGASLTIGDDADAINRYLSLVENSSSEYIKAQANFLLGRLYLQLGLPEQAYARFQDSVIRYPIYYDTYIGLVTLVEAGQPVDDLMRGIVDYYAEQYGLATAAFDRYMAINPDHDGTPLYYKALSMWKIGDYEAEIAAWEQLIEEHPTDQYISKAYLEKSSTLWRFMQEYEESADTLLSFVARYPDAPEAADYLHTAGIILEIGGYLSRASETWQRVFNEYPGAEKAYPALFKAGIVTYRLEKYPEARVIFQRLLVLSNTNEDKASANFWIAKCYQQENMPAEANTYFQQAADADTSDYYGIRAQEMLAGQAAFSPINNVDFAIDFEKERAEAEKWLREKFAIDTAVDLSSPGDLAGNPLFRRGEEFWKLGMRDNARIEFEQLRKEIQSDPVNTFKLMNHMLDLGFYQTASLSSRQVLDLAGLSPEATLTEPPVYFNHIRFGIFYRDIIVPAAIESGLDPLLVFSLIRQESLFDASITSSAGARGLMQITEPTGDFIVANYGWPENYTAADLDKPHINIKLGIHLLKIWINKYNGSVTPALASYNAGDGNTTAWMELAQGDMDLLVEVIRFDETRDYIKYIAENYAIYKNLYSHP